MKKRILIKEHEHNQVEYKYENDSTVYSTTKEEWKVMCLKDRIVDNNGVSMKTLDELERLIFANAYNQGYQDSTEENE